MRPYSLFMTLLCGLLLTIAACGGKNAERAERDKKGSDLSKNESQVLKDHGDKALKDVDASKKSEVEGLFVKLLKGLNLEGYVTAKTKSEMTGHGDKAQCIKMHKENDEFIKEVGSFNKVFSADVEKNKSDILALPETQNINPYLAHLCVEKLPQIIAAHNSFRCEDMDGKKGEKEGAATGGDKPMAAGDDKGAEKPKAQKSMKVSSPFNAANKMLTIFANDKTKADACTHFLDEYLYLQLFKNNVDLLPKTWEYIKTNSKNTEAEGEPQKKKPAAGAAPAGGGSKDKK